MKEIVSHHPSRSIRLRFSNSTDVNEEYQISHFEAAEEFGNAFSGIQKFV